MKKSLLYLNIVNIYPTCVYECTLQYSETYITHHRICVLCAMLSYSLWMHSFILHTCLSNETFIIWRWFFFMLYFSYERIFIFISNVFQSLTHHVMEKTITATFMCFHVLNFFVKILSLIFLNHWIFLKLLKNLVI